MMSKHIGGGARCPGWLPLAALPTSSRLAHKRENLVIPATCSSSTSSSRLGDELRIKMGRLRCAARSCCPLPSAARAMPLFCRPGERPFQLLLAACCLTSAAWRHLDRPLSLDRVQGTARVKVKMHSDDYCDAADGSTNSRLPAAVQPSDNSQTQTPVVRLARSNLQKRPVLTESILLCRAAIEPKDAQVSDRPVACCWFDSPMTFKDAEIRSLVFVVQGMTKGGRDESCSRLISAKTPTKVMEIREWRSNFYTYSTWELGYMMSLSAAPHYISDNLQASTGSTAFVVIQSLIFSLSTKEIQSTHELNLYPASLRNPYRIPKYPVPVQPRNPISLNPTAPHNPVAHIQQLTIPHTPQCTERIVLYVRPVTS
ncbi:hypothetical protein N431DRAFT_561133 [Stipitochalara longipes BDJ]|nr:hypothetical protein N431DRAFT_561133 [Stipitochalara longipes BDJ]